MYESVETEMNFLKALSICFIVLGLAGCFPGEKKVFEEQELQTSSARADEIAVALADAVQNQLSAYFITQAGGDANALMQQVGGDIGLVRTGQCDDGVFAYIAAGETIRGLDNLQKGSGMRMVRTLQERFGKPNVAYRSAEGVVGADGVDPACLGGADVAIGSPIITLNFTNIAETIPQDFADKVSYRTHSCSDISGNPESMGVIRKQCATRYNFNNEGEIELDANTGLPLLTQDCEEVASADLAVCQTAGLAPDRNRFDVAEGITVGTDWSAFFQNPGSDTPLTIKCITNPNGEDDCQPFNPETDRSVVVECSTDPDRVDLITNPTIQNGQIGSDSAPRDCGFGWRGDLIAEYQVRECTVWDVEHDSAGNEVSRTERATEEQKSTIYQMYYVAAECEREVQDIPIACPIGQGTVYVSRTVSMNQPLALHPHNIERGATNTYSTIAINRNDLPAGVRERSNKYFFPGENLNNAENAEDFTQRILNIMKEKLDYENTGCNIEGQSCNEVVLPPITVALVDRSESMAFGDGVSSSIPANICQIRVNQLFEDPDITCPTFNIYSKSAGSGTVINDHATCQAQKDSCLNSGAQTWECDSVYYSCRYGSNQNISDLRYILDGLKEKYQEDDRVTQALMNIASLNSNCNSTLSDAVGDFYWDTYNDPITGDEVQTERICPQDKYLEDQCHIGCSPGVCVAGSIPGGEVTKIQAVDEALRDILIPQLQYGSTFIYSYFADGVINAIKRDILRCRIEGDGQADNVPFCDYDLPRRQAVENLKQVVTDVARVRLRRNTPLFATVDTTLEKLDSVIAERKEAAQKRGEAQGLSQSEINMEIERDTTVAFYLMTDGQPTGDPGSKKHGINKACGAFDDMTALSSYFKDKYGQRSRFYVLNLPGNAQDCRQYAKQINDPIVINTTGLEETIVSDAHLTVDAFFDFNERPDNFSQLFGDTGVYNQVDPYDICEQLGLDTYDNDNPEDTLGNDGVLTCGLRSWYPPPPPPRGGSGGRTDCLEDVDGGSASFSEDGYAQDIGDAQDIDSIVDNDGCNTGGGSGGGGGGDNPGDPSEDILIDNSDIQIR